MKRFFEKVSQFFYTKQNSPAWRVLALLVAGCVVFTTTYSMIVPAITIDQSTAEEMPGIFVEDVEGPEGYYEEAAVEEEAAPSEEVTEEQAEPENDSAAGTDLGNEAVADEQNEEAEAAYTEPEYSDEEDEAFYTDEETDDAAVYADEQDAVTDEQTADEQTIEEQVVTESEEAPVIQHQFASELTYEGGDYTVTASFDTPIEYRDTLELTATEMAAPDLENEYNAYYNETVARMLEREIDGIVDARYFRFRVYADGQDIAPAGGVTFTLTYQNSTEYLYGETPYAIGFRAGDERQQDLYNAEAFSMQDGDSYFAYGYTFRVDGWDYSTVGAFRSAAPAEAEESTEEVPAETETAVSEEEAVEETEAAASEEEVVEETTLENIDATSAAESLAEPVAEEEKFEGRLRFTGDGYRVIADITQEAGLPLETELKVEEILPGNAQYEELLAQATAATAEDKNVAFARFFDISFMADGEEKEPTAGVSVRIEYSSPEKEEIKEATGVEVAAAPEASDVSVMHFGEEGLNEVESNAVEKRGKTTVEFESDAFSVYGIVYTVDFETVDGGTYSIPGGSSVALSDLMNAIGLDVTIEAVTDVKFSDPSLILVRKVTENTNIEAANNEEENNGISEDGIVEHVVYAGDWILTSLAPFTSHEVLTITTADGKKYYINVKDAQFTSNLEDLLTDIYIKIDGNKVPDGSSIEIQKGQVFDLHLEFQENDFLQLPENNSAMTFPLPEGINLGDQPFSRKIDVDLGLDGKVRGNTLSYDPVANTLSFTWNRRDPKFSRLVATDNTKLVFDVTGQFDSDTTHVDFGLDYDITVNQTEPKDANVTKNGELFLPGAADNPFGNQTAIKYIVTVTSEGETTVNVNDQVEGSAVTLVSTPGGNTGWTATSNKGTTIRPVFTNKGFSLNGQSLQDGEVVKITYWGTIDTSGIENLQNVSYQQTGNKVTLTGEGIPDKEDSHFEHEVGTNGINKSTTGVESVDENGKQVVHWKVVVNDPPMEALGGSTFTDRIASASLPYMDYDTSKSVSIIVKDANGNTVGTPRTVAWSDLSTVSESYDKHWTYTFPAGDTRAYIYEFTYDTVVDTTKYNDDKGGYFSVMNESEGKPGKDTGTATVGKPEGETPPPPIQYTKKATNVSEDTITWNISINIDQKNDGYNPFVVTEYLPHIGWNSVGYVDDLVSINVTGLQGTEWYSLEMGKNPAISGNNYASTGADQKDSMVTLTFYQDGAVDGDRTNANNHNSTEHPGLKADTSRTLNIQVVTANDPNWMQLGAEHYTDSNAPWHKNETKVNNYDVAHDTVKPMKKTVLKLRDGSTAVTQASTATAFKEVEFSTDHGKATDETHKEYPAVKYWVLVGGITDTNLENGNQIIITDRFDSHYRLMGVDHNSQDGLENDKRPLIYGTSETGSLGTQLDETALTWTQTADGTATFTITNPPKNGDNYYPYYLVQYWLVAKSEEDFNAIKMEALNNDGQARFKNIATSDDISAELDFTYNYSVIDKSSVEDSSGLVTLLKYTIDINKDCLTLNNGDTMTMTDTYSANLSIDFGTVEILEAVDKNGNDRTSDITWDFRSHVGTYTIPDETHVKIQYYARPVGDPGSVQTVTNTAYMEGYYDSETKDQMVDMSGGGSAEVVRIRLLKFGADHMEEGLNGAVFRLLDQDKNALKTFTTAETGFVNKYGVLHAGNDPLDYEYDEASNSYKISVNSYLLTPEAQAKLTEGILKTTIKDNDFDSPNQTWEEYLVQHSDTLVCYNDLNDAGLSALGITRHAGFAEIMMNQSIDGMALKKERVYYLQEIVAPPGYELDTTLYSFLISDQANYAAPAGVYVYHNNDVLTVRNWPEETPVLKLQKTFTGNVELTDEQKNAVTFQIQKKEDENWTDYTVPVWRDGRKQDVATFTYGDYGVIEDTSTTPSTYSQGELLFKNGVMVIENLPAGEYRVIESNQAMKKPGGGNYDRRTEYLVDGSTVRVNDDIISYNSETGAETKNSDNEANGVVFTTDGESSHFVSITNTYFIEEFTLTKTASDTGELLGNAKFAIYSRTDSNNDTLIKNNIATDANGKIEIQKTGNAWDSSITFAENTLYYIVETEAPAGYITPESPDKYYFYFSSEGSTFDPSSLLPTGEKAVDLSTGFGTTRVSNNRDSEKTYVNVKKTWVNSLGQDITDSMTDAEGVSVTLNRTTAKPTAGKAITTVGIEESEVDLANLHTLTFTNSKNNQSSRVYFLAGDKLQISIYGTDLTSVNAPSGTTLTNVATTKTMKSWTATAANSDLTVTINDDAVTGISVSNVTAANRSYVLTEAEAESLNGEAVTPDGTVTLNTQNNWAHTFSNLPVADDSGNLYFYYITEPSSNAQDTSIGIKGKEITVTNTAPDQLEVNKKWEDYEGNSVNAEKTDGSITYELYQVENPLEMSPTYTHEGNIAVNVTSLYKSNYYPGTETVMLSGDAADGKIKSGSNIKIEITTAAGDNNSLMGEINVTGGTARGTGIGADAAIIENNPQQGVVNKRTIYVDNVTSTVALSGIFQCSGGNATVAVTVTGEPSAQELPFDSLIQKKMGKVVVAYDNATLTKEPAFSTSSVRVSPGTKPWSSLIYNLPSSGTGTGANAGQRVNYTYYVVETPSPVARNYDAATYQVDGQNVGIANGEPGDTIVIINKENQPPYGSLFITKRLQTGSPDASDKTFTFEVELKNGDNTAYTGPVKVLDKNRTTATDDTPDSTGKITVTVAGTGTATISEIPVGTKYVVTEPAANLPGGWTQDGTVAYGDPTQTIAANDADTAIVTNKYDAVDIDVTKTWKQAGSNDSINSTLKNATVTFTLQKSTNGTDWSPVVTSTDANGSANPVTLSVTDADATKWKASWTNLPRYEDVGGTPTLILYKVVESDAKINTNGTAENVTPAGNAAEVVIVNEVGDYIAAAAPHKNPYAGGDLTNTLPTVDVEGTKVWEILGNKLPDDPTLKLTRTSSKEGSNAETVINADNTTDLQPTWTNGDDTKSRKFKYSGLPKYDNEGYAYKYTVTEAGFVVDGKSYTVVKEGTGFVVKVGDNVVNTFEVKQNDNNIITNTEKTEFEFTKIWRDYVGADATWPENLTITVTFNAYTDSSNKAGVLEDQTLTFSPSSVPNGWTKIQTEDGKKTTFKISGLKAKDESGKVYTYYVKEKQVAGYKEPSYETSEGGPLTAADRAINKQHIINTPYDAVELPSTGGIGTTPYTIAGSLLMAFTALAYIFKKKRLTLATVTDSYDSQSPRDRK